METELFLFKNYNFNSIENISLIYLQSFIYKEKFEEGRILEKAFFYNYKNLIMNFTSLPMLAHKVRYIMKVLNLEFGTN